MTESVRNASFVMTISQHYLLLLEPSSWPGASVTLTLTGSGSGSTLSDGSGNYSFSSLVLTGRVP